MKLTNLRGNHQRTRTSLLTALLVGTLLVQNAGAQSSKEAVLNASAVAPTTTTAAADISALVAKSPASALLAVDQNRGSIIETIVNFWQADASASKDASVRVAEGAELRATLSSLRADHLLAASNARTLDGLKQIFAFADAGTVANKDADSVKSGQKSAIAPASLGSLTNDLVYTPITPCKLVDTRTPGTGYSYAAGGAFAASQKRTYDSYNFCGPIPQNIAAIQVSVNTQYGGAGGGILSLMANAAAAPVTNIFYAGYAPVTTVVPVNGPGSGGLFDAQISGVAGADLIIDVVGYYAAPVATALQCQYATGPAVSVAAGAYQTMSIVACAAGYTVVGPAFQAANNVVLADNYPSGGGWFMAVKNVGASAVTVTPAAQCCRIPGR
jgi:hypothetical protein